jgi:D-beta-D-heptose 7-phosphate kinase / D-beta-D-heptose 1-phosphate adenosyltransferase
MVIFTNGCFDILHVGHVRYLEQSRALGTRLVVGVNSDASVRRLKGLSRPINCQQDRAQVLKALRCVDEVVIFDEDTPYELIRLLRPDIVTKGGDYLPEEVVGYGLSKVVVLPYTDGRSTTRILQHARGSEGLGSGRNLGRQPRLLRKKPSI